METQLPSTTCPKLFQAIFAIASQVEAPISMVLTSVLQTASVAVKSLYSVQCPAGGVSPLNLYTVVIAPSGERKTSTFNMANRGIERFEEEMELKYSYEFLKKGDKKAYLKEQIRSKRKLLSAATEMGDNTTAMVLSSEINLLNKELNDPVHSIRIRYQNISQLGFLKNLSHGVRNAYLCSAEGGTVFDKENIHNLPYFNDLWSGEKILVDRYHKNFQVSNISLNIGIMIQKEIFEKFARQNKGEAHASGFTARLLITEPESNMGHRTNNTSPEQAAINEAHIKSFDEQAYNFLCKSHDKNDNPNEVIFISPAAAKAWQDYANLVEVNMGKGKRLSDITDFASKLGNYICRIAGIIHSFEEKFGEINLETMNLAILIGHNYLLEYKNKFGALDSIQQLEIDAHALHKWLYTQYKQAPNDRYTRTQILQLITPKVLRSKARLEAAFELLISKGIANYMPGPKTAPYMYLCNTSFGFNSTPKPPGPAPKAIQIQPNWNQLLGIPSISLEEIPSNEEAALPIKTPTTKRATSTSHILLPTKFS